MAITLPSLVSVKHCDRFVISQFYVLVCALGRHSIYCVSIYIFSGGGEMDNFYCLVYPQLNLIGHCYGLSVKETNDLWVQADIDGNGVIDYNEFKVQARQTSF